MKITEKHTLFVQRLVPLWNVTRKAPTAGNTNCTVKRAGRELTKKDYKQLGKTAMTKGGENNVNIQFGFLGGFGGGRILGESPG